MRISGRFLSIGAILSLGLSLGLSGPAALAQPATPKPPRSVTCVYEAVSPEMRTLVDDLFETVRARGEDPLKNTDVRTAVEAQIAAARNLCVDLYPLTAGETEIAGNFAVTNLIADFVARLIRTNNADPAQVTLYLQARLARLPLLRVPTAAEIAAVRARMPAEWPAQAKDQMARRVFQNQSRRPTKQEIALLVADLTAKGWKFNVPQMQPLAEFYLALQMQLAFYRQAYAKL